MKVLLDECLPVDLRKYLSGHEAHSAEWAGFKGLKNGELLRQAEDAGYDVLLRTDQGVPLLAALPNCRQNVRNMFCAGGGDRVVA